MKRLAQEARVRQGVVDYAEKHGKSEAARKYGVSLSSVKRWSKRYDGTWQSLQERSHRDRTVIPDNIQRQKRQPYGKRSSKHTHGMAGMESMLNC